MKLAFKKDDQEALPEEEQHRSSLVNNYEIASGLTTMTDEEARELFFEEAQKLVAEKAAEDAKTQQTAGPKEK